MFINFAPSLAVWQPILIRHVQSDHIYYYAFAMMISLLLLMTLVLNR